ncbi:MAG: ABC transporter permease [Thermofilaceae archaeon]
MNDSIKACFLIAYRDLRRFWKFKHWLAAQLAMNLADVLIFALVFNNIVNRNFIPDYIKFMSTGILAIATFASAFSIGREVGGEMRREVHYYLLSLPTSRGALAAGRFLGGALRGLIYQLAFIVLNLLIVGVPSPAQSLAIAYTSFLFSLSMSALAIAVVSSTRDFNLQSTFRALIYYTLFFFSNVFYPKEIISLRFPGPLAVIVAHAPISRAAEVYRWGFGYYSSLDHLALPEVTLWTILLLSAATLLYTRNLSKQ